MYFVLHDTSLTLHLLLQMTGCREAKVPLFVCSYKWLGAERQKFHSSSALTNDWVQRGKSSTLRLLLQMTGCREAKVPLFVCSYKWLGAERQKFHSSSALTNDWVQRGKSSTLRLLLQMTGCREAKVPLFVCSYKWLGAERQKFQQETYHGIEHFVLVSYFSAYINGHLKKRKTCSRIHLLYIMTSVSISYKCLHTVQGTNDKCQHTIQGTNDKCQHTIQRNKEAVVSNEPSCAKKEKEKK